jgi:23S rRNA (adenine2503-C2)-methyltransferase
VSAVVALLGHTPETLVTALPNAGLSLKVARRLLARVFDDPEPRNFVTPADFAAFAATVPGLSRAVISHLASRVCREKLEVVDRRRSAVDPFVKYLFRARDGKAFEAVRIPLDQPRWSVCVSSQAGCALGCAFCETGRVGFERNLEVDEIVEQVVTIRRESPERPVTGVVFQGQGEPLQNYENVLGAAKVLRNPCGGHIGSDRITLSTVGLLPAIERYVEEGHPYRLILSLTSAFQEKRARLLPVAGRWDVARLADAMKRLAARQRNVVNLAWVLMSGVNTQDEEARELARLFAGSRVRLSVIDVNDPTGQFRRASDEERSRFLSALGDQGIGFVRRYSGGPDIHAACGMLAATARGGTNEPVAASV